MFVVSSVAQGEKPVVEKHDIRHQRWGMSCFLGRALFTNDPHNKAQLYSVLCCVDLEKSVMSEGEM